MSLKSAATRFSRQIATGSGLASFFRCSGDPPRCGHGGTRARTDVARGRECPETFDCQLTRYASP